ncbi:hypothetical protein BGX31_007900 [Mortierella sp. GBA43]|nr:hypothetical protein BGX31_007900 [Mortierella sp. GBA43]
MELSHEDDIEVAELLQTPITSKVHPVSESSLASIASSPPGSNPMSSAATSPSAYRSKPSLVSLPLQYWRSLSNTQPLFHRADSPVSYAPSFTQSYLSNTFSKKKKLNIPTIVIHPDEEDGEPPRVLSQKDIDYLSTMPPPPLRLLIQPWDDLSEEEEYDDMDNTEYGPDDCHPDHHESHHHHHHHHDLEKDQEHAEEEEEDDMELTGTACMGMISIGDRGFDPYALDVPIELDVDIQELTRNNASSTTKYRVTER